MIIKFKDLKNGDLVIWGYKDDIFNKKRTIKIIDKNAIDHQFDVACLNLGMDGIKRFLAYRYELDKFVFKLLSPRREEDDTGMDFI